MSVRVRERESERERERERERVRERERDGHTISCRNCGMARATVRAPVCLALSWSWRRAERRSSLPVPIPRSLVPVEWNRDRH